MPLEHLSPEATEWLESTAQTELLRFTTAGSVDDGKSTLIGRLLYDSKGVYEDQLASVRKATRNLSTNGLDLSLLTDGLRAEREQGITIDVAYRYFSTPRRKFIIADTPGHEQYTRNMATGASTANLAIILIDARYGVLPQSRRHAFIAALLGIPHLVVAVNKMDLMEFREDVFNAIRDEFRAFAAQIDAGDIVYIPISALDGDNVVNRSQRTPWYDGPALLEHLETVPIARDINLTDLRFPVQYVIRPNLDFRGFAGTLASGVVRRGDADHGAALRPHQPREIHRHLGRRAGRGVRPHVGHGVPGRRDRCQPRRHAGAARQPAARRAPLRRHRGVDEPEAAGAQPVLPDQTDHAGHAGPRARNPLPHRRQHAGAPAGARAGTERHRRGQRGSAASAALRPVPQEPLHRQFHPDRPDHQRDHGRGHDPAGGSDAGSRPDGSRMSSAGPCAATVRWPSACRRTVRTWPGFWSGACSTTATPST